MASVWAASGSMTVRPGSSARSMAWGSSMGAFFRTATLGGIRGMTTPSVARMRASEPGS
jgi:hypothetical protein